MWVRVACVGESCFGRQKNPYRETHTVCLGRYRTTRDHPQSRCRRIYGLGTAFSEDSGREKSASRGYGVFDRGDEMVSSRRRGAEPSKAVRTEESLVDRSKLPAFFSHAWFLVGSVESILLVTWPSFASRSTSGWRRFGHRRSRKIMRLG